MTWRVTDIKPDWVGDPRLPAEDVDLGALSVATFLGCEGPATEPERPDGSYSVVWDGTRTKVYHDGVLTADWVPIKGTGRPDRITVTVELEKWEPFAGSTANDNPQQYQNSVIDRGLILSGQATATATIEYSESDEGVSAKPPESADMGKPLREMGIKDIGEMLDLHEVILASLYNRKPPLLWE